MKNMEEVKYPYKLLGEKINSFSDFEKLLEKIAPQLDEIEKGKEIPNIDDGVEFIEIGKNVDIKEKLGWTEQDLKDFEMLADYLEKHPSTEKELEEWEKRQDNMTLGEIADFLIEDMKFMGEKINLPEPDDKIYIEGV